MKVDYILAFTVFIYDVLRKTNMDMATLHLVYEMWDSMIEDVRKIIYQHEGKERHKLNIHLYGYGYSSFSV